MDGGVPQQPAGILCDVLCSTPISRRWSTGKQWVGVARPSQRVGKRFHELPQAKCGELKDCVEGEIIGYRVRGGDSRLWC